MTKKTKAWKPKKPYAIMKARSPRVELRPYRLSDLGAWQKAHQSRSKRRHSFDEGPLPAKRLTRAAFFRMKRHQEKRASRRGCFVFGIFARKTGAHLGVVDLYIINAHMRCANLGYAIHNHSWGQGYGSEAARLALKIAFGALSLKRVEASCELRNKASARVARKSGMMPEGISRKYPIPVGMRDLFVFGMNSIDYRRRR